MKPIALVTGGTRGIGRAITVDLARKGYHVLALYARNRKAAESLQEEAKKEKLSVETLRGDLTDQAKIKGLLSDIKARHPKINVVVHNAASGVHRPVEELTAKHIRWTYEINVLAAHELIMGLLDYFNEDARIIGITSSGGTHVIPYYAAVGSSKGALESLFRHYAAELAPRKIAVNLVCPGMVMTEAIEAFPDRNERVENCLRDTPTRKLTEADEVADLVSFLATSRAGSQIIGQTFRIDGGRCIKS